MTTRAPEEVEGVDGPAGAELLRLLRGDEAARPVVDVEAADAVRAALEAAVAPGLAALPAEVTVRVTKDRVRDVLACEARLLTRIWAEPGRAQPSLAVLLGRLADQLFALAVVGCPAGPEPLRGALAAADAAGDRHLRVAVEALAPSARVDLAAQLDRVARSLARRWPRLPAQAWVRLQEPLRVELAGGRVLLTGSVDMMVGHARAERAGVTLIDVKSGGRRHEHRADAAWYGLLETLRTGVGPFQVGSYYLGDGGIDLSVFDHDELAVATRRVANALDRLVGLAAGREGRRTPGPLCPWCDGLPGCAPGQAHTAVADA